MEKCGGVLFRNFPINGPADFSNAIKTLELGAFLNYVGGDSPRTKIADGVYTSTEAPPGVKIPLHNELSFVKNYPRYIHFYCETPPINRGETILADARVIYQHIDPSVKSALSNKGLRYVSAYYDTSPVMDLVNKFQKGHKTWSDVFETRNKREVEIKCQENEFAYRWMTHDWLELIQQRPAFLAHPTTQEMVWFNQAHLFDLNPKFLGWWRYMGAKLLYCRKNHTLHRIFFGDNTKIPRSMIYHIYDVLDQNTISFPWQKGDLLILDNILAMHGRNPFSGKRRVLTAMTG